MAIVDGDRVSAASHDIAGNSFDCFLVGTIFIDMNDYFLGFIAFGLDFSSLEVDMNHINLFLLFFDGPGQILSLFFVFGYILFVLPDAIFILSNCEAMFVFEELNLFDQVGDFFFQFCVLEFEFFVSESGGLDVFVDNFLNFNYLLNNLLNLNWSLDVDRFNSHLLFHFSAGLYFLS